MSIKLSLDSKWLDKSEDKTNDNYECSGLFHILRQGTNCFKFQWRNQKRGSVLTPWLGWRSTVGCHVLWIVKTFCLIDCGGILLFVCDFLTWICNYRLSQPNQTNYCAVDDQQSVGQCSGTLYPAETSQVNGRISMKTVVVLRKETGSKCNWSNQSLDFLGSQSSRWA